MTNKTKSSMHYLAKMQNPVAALILAAMLLQGCSRQHGTQVVADFSLKVEGRMEGNTTSLLRILYQHPNKWRNETIIISADGTTMNTINVCDGFFLWSFTSFDNGCEKWDVNALAKEVGEAEAYAFLRRASFVCPPANTKMDRWATEFGQASGWREVGDEEHGGVPCVLYEYVDEIKVKTWFAKSDGLLREQTIFKPTGQEWIRYTVTEVVVDTKVSSSEFTFAPPRGAKVIDRTPKELPGEGGVRE